jgi:hypothetical protein
MVWLSGIVDYDTVEEILEKVGQIHVVSGRVVWRGIGQIEWSRWENERTGSSMVASES